MALDIEFMKQLRVASLDDGLRLLSENYPYSTFFSPVSKGERETFLRIAKAFLKLHTSSSELAGKILSELQTLAADGTGLDSFFKVTIPRELDHSTIKGFFEEQKESPIRGKDTKKLTKLIADLRLALHESNINDSVKTDLLASLDRLQTDVDKALVDPEKFAGTMWQIQFWAIAAKAYDVAKKVAPFAPILGKILAERANVPELSFDEMNFLPHETDIPKE